MTAKLFKQFGIALLAAVYSVGMVVAGYSYALRGKGDAIEAMLKDDAERVTEARIDARVIEKEVIKYVDRIKTVVDTTGCADTVASPAISDGLQQIFNTAKRSTPD